MTTKEFIGLLEKYPGRTVEIELPDGTLVPAHFHVTEVGHITKRFVDCGGKVHENEAALLQLWVADDFDHRVDSSKLLAIMTRADELLPSLDLPVEIEHEAPVLTQMPIEACRVADGSLRLVLGLKATACLAKDVCLPDFRLPAMPGICAPGSGCC